MCVGSPNNRRRLRHVARHLVADDGHAVVREEPHAEPALAAPPLRLLRACGQSWGALVGDATLYSHLNVVF